MRKRKEHLMSLSSLCNTQMDPSIVDESFLKCKAQKLGHGSSGDVYKINADDVKGLSKSDFPASFALKVFGEKFSQARIRGELEALVSVRGHPNIIRLFGVVTDPSSGNVLGYAMELIRNTRTSLDHYVGMTSRQHLDCLYRLIHALQYCHTKQVRHGDLKPENVCINKAKNDIKLIDFSLGNFMSDSTRVWGGTRGYIAPETCLHTLAKLDMTPSSDMWSIGWIMCDMLCPFHIKNHSADVSKCSTTEDRYLANVKHYATIFPHAALEWLSSLDQSGAHHSDKMVFSDLVQPNHRKLLGKNLVLNDRERLGYNKQCLEYFVSSNLSDIKAFRAKSPELLRVAMDHQRRRIDDLFTKNYLDLMARCLEIDPEKRISAFEAIHHPLFVQKL